VEDLLRRAAEHGFRAVALTDVENLYGQVRFHGAARHNGVKPITGVKSRAGYGPGALVRKAGSSGTIAVPPQEITNDEAPMAKRDNNVERRLDPFRISLLVVSH
jgi:hypothetical protein